MLRKIIILFLTILFGSIAVFPFSVLRVFSKGIYFFMYKIFNYRRDVVNLNLIYALPDVKSEDLEQIEKDFYRHLSELIIEIIKGLFIPLNLLLQRITFTEETLQLIDRLNKTKSHAILMLGHYGNWEWPLMIIQNYTHMKPFSFYAPMSFKAMDDFIKERRERFGATMLDATKTQTVLETLKAQPSIIAIVGDQSPTGRSRVHETRFLSLDTKFFNGGEKLARNLDAVVLYVHLKKTGFAQYVIDLEVITEYPAELPEGEITEKYIRILESEIRQKPSNWVWSHKRWKGSIPY